MLVSLSLPPPTSPGVRGSARAWNTVTRTCPTVRRANAASPEVITGSQSFTPTHSSSRMWMDNPVLTSPRIHARGRRISLKDTVRHHCVFLRVSDPTLAQLGPQTLGHAPDSKAELWSSGKGAGKLSHIGLQPKREHRRQQSRVTGLLVSKLLFLVN